MENNLRIMNERAAAPARDMNRELKLLNEKMERMLGLLEKIEANTRRRT